MYIGERVTELVLECTAPDSEGAYGRTVFHLLHGTLPESEDGAVGEWLAVRGIRALALFDRTKLEALRADVQQLIQRTAQDQFFEARGGGETVVKLSLDRTGQVWGQPMHADLLICLALGLQEGRFCVPQRAFWQSMPERLPYFVFRDPAVPFKTVHLLLGGAALCGLRGIPASWPDGHMWDSMDGIENVNCVGCHWVLGITARSS